jgi:hypothetical protein
MIANAHNTNGHAVGKTPVDIIDRLVELDRAYFERRRDREATSTYADGKTHRSNSDSESLDVS